MAANDDPSRGQFNNGGPDTVVAKKISLGFGCVISVLWLVLIARAVWLLSQHDHYLRLAERNRLLRQIIRAPRGLISDRQGVILAGNELHYSEVKTVDGELREYPLTKEAALPLLATAPASVRTSYQRTYPLGPITSQLVGYVDQPADSEAVITGRTGIEHLKQTQLAGQDGIAVYERNALGQATRILRQQAAVKGEDQSLTIDAELSQVAWEALGKHRGAVIVSVPQTGEILTAISSPSFIPEINPSQAVIDQWSADRNIGKVAPSLVAALDWPDNPFLYRPLAAQYPPGSIFKIVTALAGLEYDAITADTQVRDEGVLKVGDFQYTNWYWNQYGRVEGDIAVVRALARSNDIFFYKVAEWVGPERLAQFARLLALGQRTQHVLSGERAGLVPDPGWKQLHFGESWYLGNTYHMGIGQGDVLTTPLQLSVLLSTVAARGRRCEPRFLLNQLSSCAEVSLDSDSLALVVQGLRQVCSAGGTAFPFFTTPYDVMGKTGTAEFGAPDEEGQRPTHGWFTVAASHRDRQPPDTPDFTAEIVVTVLIESDEIKIFQEGSGDAAPVAKTILDWWYQNR